MRKIFIFIFSFPVQSQGQERQVFILFLFVKLLFCLSTENVGFLEVLALCSDLRLIFTLYGLPGFASSLMNSGDFVNEMTSRLFFVWIHSFTYFLASQDFLLA